MRGIMSEEHDRLNALSYEALLAWLVEALHGRKAIPSLSPDEPFYVGILRLEADLDKPTRRDLARACEALVHEFVRSCPDDIEFATSLLRLTVGLELESVAGALARMAETFPTLPRVPGTVKQLVLAALVDLKVSQSVEFWRAILDQDHKAFAGTAIAGLLAYNMSVAIEVVPTLPDDQNIADAIATVLEQATDQLAPAQRCEVYAHIRRVLSACSPLMHGSIQEWLEERGELAPTQNSKNILMSAITAEEVSPRQSQSSTSSAARHQGNFRGLHGSRRHFHGQRSAA
jgi:hypothetical protein